jgi:hypothetical protein
MLPLANMALGQVLRVLAMLPTAACLLIMLQPMLYGFYPDSILKTTHSFIHSQIVSNPNT